MVSMSAPPLTGEPPTLPLAAAALSHPGRQRPDNEDAFGNFVDGRLFVVADGMGGHNAGAVASAMAVEAIETFFHSYHAEPHQIWPYPVDRSLSLAANLLRVGIKVANDRIRTAAAADRARARMGTTARRDGDRRGAAGDRARGRQPRLPVARRERHAPHARPLGRRGDARGAAGDDRRGAGDVRAPQRRHAQPRQQGRARADRLRRVAFSRATSTSSAATACGVWSPTGR